MTDAERRLIAAALTWEEHRTTLDEENLTVACNAVAFERVNPEDLTAYKAAIEASREADRIRQAAFAKLGVTGKALGRLLEKP